MDNRVFCMDCMEALKTTPDKYYDLCVADPPYGLNITGRHRGEAADTHTHTPRARIGSSKPFGSKGDGVRRERESVIEAKFYPVFDDSSPPDAEVFREPERVSKKLIIWGGNFFLDHLGAASCLIVWDKKRRGMSQADCEIAWTNLKGQSRVFEWKWNGMLQQDMKHKGKRIHATQKPVALYRYLFDNWAEPGDKVLDPYLGSGSSRIAAWEAGLDFTGYEINETYFRLQEERFAEHTAQARLALDG